MKEMATHSLTAFVSKIYEENAGKPYTATILTIAWVMVVCYPFYANSHFASAQDLGEVKEAVNISAELQIAEKLRFAQNARCKAKDNNDVIEVNRISVSIDEWQQKYVRVAGMRYDIPKCGDL